MNVRVGRFTGDVRTECVGSENEIRENRERYWCELRERSNRAYRDREE